MANLTNQIQVLVGEYFRSAYHLQVQNEWEEFLRKGIPELVDAAIKGTEGGMDPKGGCDDCTNEEIKAAVEYIVSQAQK